MFSLIFFFCFVYLFVATAKRVAASHADRKLERNIDIEEGGKMIPRGNRPGWAPTTEHSQELDPFCRGIGVPGLEKADPAKNSHPFHRQQKVLSEHRGNYSVYWSQSIGLHSGCGYRASVTDKPETAASRSLTWSIPLQLAEVCPSRPGSKFTSEQ